MVKKMIRSIIPSKILNNLYLIYGLGNFKAEKIPQLDKIIFWVFYRFGFFRNAFLKQRRKTLANDGTQSELASDFAFNEKELLETEQNGISKVFHVRAEIISKIKALVNSKPLYVEGKLIQNSVKMFGDSKFVVRDLHGTYHYRGLTIQPEMLEIFLAPEILKFVSGYLRSDSVFVDTLAWWSFPNKVAVGANGDFYDPKGQNFHYDHTHRRQLKLFVYLTDCDKNTGAHCYLKKTHRVKPVAMQLQHKGLSEEQMQTYLKKDEDWLCIEGPAGSAFLADPFGIHKGLEPTRGSRLMLQVMYSVDPLRHLNLSLNVNVSEQIGHGQ